MSEIQSIENLLKNLTEAMISDPKVYKESAIFYLEGEWQVHIGNEYSSVMLGEVDGLYSGEGDTLEKAFDNLMDNFYKEAK